MPSLRAPRSGLTALRALLACVACIGVAHAAPGDLDPSFGSGFGKVITAFASNSSVRALAVQPDGKLVAAGICGSGSNTDVCLARYNADGSLDTAFGSGGTAVTAIGSFEDNALALVLQADGKLVVAGYCSNGSNPDFCLARYHTNGSLDTSFNGNGKVITAIGNSYDVANALVVQPDGKLVAAGSCLNSSSNYDFCLARYNSNGSLDAAFGTGGTVVTPIGSSDDQAYALALQPDGKLVVAGTCNNGGNDPCLARYNANGSLDTTFNLSGKAITPIGGSFNAVRALAVQPDGKLVVAGFCLNVGNADFCLVRYNTNGSFDSAFGNSGKVLTAIGNGDDYAYALALQPDGRLIAAGYCLNGSNYDFCLARYNADGSLDASFNTSGKVLTPIGSGDDRAFALALQPDGKLVAAGVRIDGSNNAFGLVRYEGGPFGYRSCSLDIDGDNQVLATTDMLIGARVALGMTGSAVVNGINFAANATRNTWPLIRSYLVSQCGMAIAP